MVEVWIIIIIVCMLRLICSACVSDSLFCTAQDPDVLLHVLSGHGSEGQQQQQQSLACVQQQKCCHCGCKGWIGWYQCMHALWVGVFCMRQNQADFSHSWPCWVVQMGVHCMLCHLTDWPMLAAVYSLVRFKLVMALSHRMHGWYVCCMHAWVCMEMPRRGRATVVVML